MGLREIVSWYQKKIGTYDKQLWEKTVEQRILHGLKHVPMKTAKLRTDFIDVDLVKGSSFPKAKPKHGLITVARLGIFRLFFLPIYGRWWIKQTSFRIFSLIFVMYILEFINLVLYVNRPLVRNDQKERVSSSEVIIPLVMMTLLSIIHSQIVSTTPESGKRNNEVKSHKTKRRRKLRQRKLFSDQKPSKHTKHEPDNLKKKVEHNRHVLWDINDRSTTPVENIEEKIENGEEALKKQPLDDDGFESLTNSVPSENEDQLNKSSEKNTKNRDCSSDDLPNKSSFSSDKNGSEDSTQNTNETEIYKNEKFTSEKHESETDSDQNLLKIRSSKRTKMTIRQGILHTRTVESSDCDTEDECETVSSPETVDTTVNPTDWMGVTTNSDDCSYSSEYDDTDDQSEPNLNDQFWDMDLLPTAILSPSCTSRDRVSCTIWEHNDIKKADLSVLDISSTIIERVEAMPETMDYFYGGVLLSVLLSLVPTIILFCGIMVEPTVIAEAHLTIVEISGLMLEQLLELVYQIMDMILGFQVWERFIIITSIFLRCVLGSLFFFLMALAERTFKQRFLYAKLFSHLTSSRRARKSNLPHFRLNKVRNIKTWLSVRSYLKKRGPQRSVDLIVSAAFIITLILLSFISIELLRDSIFLHSQYNLEAVLWCLAIGIYLLRFMTLGTTINSKYRNLSVLITEQINLYLQIEQKPHKKDELMVANSVLKLAADLLKELESPFKISGLSANPYLYTVTKVVILSALSGVLSEMLGFKLKLYKIKIV